MTDLHNTIAEESILAAILLENSLLNKITFLRAEHFYHNEFAELFLAIIEKLKLQDEVSSIDFAGLSASRFPDNPNWVFQLDVKIVGLVSCARKVKDLAEKRVIQEVLSAKLSEIVNSDLSSDEHISDLNNKFKDFSNCNNHFQIKTFKQVCLENIEDMQNPPQIYPTGYHKIDRSMNGGLHAGCSYCVAAKPKAGKTMLKGSIANNLRQGKDKFLFVAAEMGSKAINKRLLGAGLNRSPKAFDSYDQGFSNSVRFVADNDAGSMYYVDAPRVALDDLIMIVKKAIYNYGITGFILDYVQLVSGMPKGGNPVQHLENVTQSIAEICKRENIWCLYSAQINREGNLRGGDAMIQSVEWLYELRQTEASQESEEPAEAYLSHIATRESEPMNLGSEDMPYLKITKTGTKMEEI